MTTTVVVKAYEYPVRITAINPKTRLKLENVVNEIVDPQTEKEVVVTKEKAIIVTELKK